MISIKGLDKAEVLAALYNRAKTGGMGVFHYSPLPMTAAEAKDLLGRQDYFDYVNGRVMKVSLTGDEFNEYMYDRDNGSGAALSAINTLAVNGDRK